MNKSTISNKSIKPKQESQPTSAGPVAQALISLHKQDKFFFKKQERHSQIKATIVEKYVAAWANIMPGNEVLYLDFFAGPGRYADNSPSTPILLIERITRNQSLLKKVHFHFYDHDKNSVDKLRREIKSIENIEKLKFAPVVKEYSVNNSTSEKVGSYKLIPTFLFLDPFGYKGLTNALIKSVIKDYGSECIFFVSVSCRPS